MNLLISLVALRDGGQQLAVLVDDPQGRVGKLDGDGLAGVAEADLDALARDLDAAVAGYPPPDGRAGLWQPVWPGEADALKPVCRCLGGMGTAGSATERRPG